MKRIAVLLLLAFLCAGPSCADAPPDAALTDETSFAITDVTIIDVLDGITVPGQTVVVVGDEIHQICAVDVIFLSQDYTIVDGRGLYLMPGLVDAHVHFIDGPVFGRLMIANGVVLVRDTGLPTSEIIELRDQLNRGDVLGPEMVATGAVLDGNPPLIPSVSLAVSTSEEARAVVRQHAEAGVNMIKVYSRLEADVFLAIVEEAHALGLKVIGHVPDSITIEDAADAGLDSSEHLFGFDKLIGRLLGASVKPYYDGMGTDVRYFLQLAEVNAGELQHVLEGLRDAGLTVCPTVVVFKVGMQTSMFQSGEFPQSEFISQEVLDTWNNLWPDQSDLPEFVWQTWAQLVAEIHQVGIPLMIGTDVSVPGAIPGFSVHDEMKIWQEAGIAPADILRSATVVPSRFMGMGDRLGSIEEGKIASMVLLRANPLDDVGNAAEIEAVFLRGCYFDSSNLTGLLDEAAEIAQRP